MGSAENFRPRFAFLKFKKRKQELFNAYRAEANHNGKDDSKVRPIDQAAAIEELRKSESFWQRKLDT